MDDFEIKHVNGHYEAFSNGKFVVSGDTFAEVVKELMKGDEEND